MPYKTNIVSLIKLGGVNGPKVLHKIRWREWAVEATGLSTQCTVETAEKSTLRWKLLGEGTQVVEPGKEGV